MHAFALSTVSADFGKTICYFLVIVPPPHTPTVNHLSSDPNPDGPAASEVRGYRIIGISQDHLARAVSLWSPTFDLKGAAVTTRRKDEVRRENYPGTPLSREDLMLAQTVYLKQSLPFPLYLVGSFFAQLTAPLVSTYLSATRGFSNDAAERLNRTYTFVQTLLMYGPESPEGEAVIDQVRSQHDRLNVPVSSPEFEYIVFTLTRGVADTLREMSPFPPTPKEELAWFKLWRRVGEKLGATSIPADYEEFVSRNRALEEAYRSTQNSAAMVLGPALLSSMTQFAGPILRPLGWLCIAALISPDSAHQLGTPKLRKLERGAVCTLMHLAAHVSGIMRLWPRTMPPDRTSEAKAA